MYGAEILAKCSEVIEEYPNGEAGVSELARDTGYPISTVLYALRKSPLWTQNEISKKWRITKTMEDIWPDPDDEERKEIERLLKNKDIVELQDFYRMYKGIVALVIAKRDFFFHTIREILE
ncbi:MAG: hypothetical protein ACREOB_00255 [Thermodesulfobacteriota bacterium]